MPGERIPGMGTDPAPPNPTFDETARFAIGFAVLAIPVAIVLTVLGVRMKNFTPLFVIAWVISCASAWIFSRWIVNPWPRWIVRLVVAPVALASILYEIDRAYPPTEAKEVTIVWEAPAPIPEGTPLSDVQLNAKAFCDQNELAGTSIYNPAKGAILSHGTQTLHVTFKPSDPMSYLENEKTVLIVVTAPHAPSLKPLVTTSFELLHDNNGLPSILRVYFNNPGPALKTTTRHGLHFVPTIVNTVDRYKIEDDIWSHFLATEGADVTTTLPGYTNGIFMTMGEGKQLPQVAVDWWKYGTHTIYFTGIAKEAGSNTVLKEVCAYLVTEAQGVQLCHDHNGP